MADKFSHDLTGKRFGRLIAITRLPCASDGTAQWHCRCDCGREKIFRANNLVHGRSTSCGCLRRERMREFATTHGLSHLPEHGVWATMRSRCHNSNDKRYSDYGARGIAVCARWRESFPAFLADMGKRPSPNHSIDRINNDGNYEPSNCRWATAKEQAANRRARAFRKDGVK